MWLNYNMSAHYTTDTPGAEDSLIRTEALKFLHELPLTICYTTSLSFYFVDSLKEIFT